MTARRPTPKRVERASAPKPGKRIPRARIEEALRKTSGNIARAAQALGANRRTLFRRIEADAALRAVVDEVRDELLDLCESTLLAKVKSGDLHAVIFVLKTLGRSRGYVERSELGGAPDAPPIKFYMPAKKALPEDDEPLATIPVEGLASGRSTPQAVPPKEKLDVC